MILKATLLAVGPGITSSFLAGAGTAPYTYAVAAGGAGGSINPTTGLYTAPAVVNPDSRQDPRKLYDTVTATDADGATASLRILVGTPLLLFCDVIQREMGLQEGRVYLWDQRIMQPKDSEIYIAVSELTCKPFGVTTELDADGDEVQSVNMMSTLQVDIISRGPGARDRKEEIILAVNSFYAQSQQEANGFYIGKLPAGSRFTNLSQEDGAAIPYRFNILVNIQYTKVKEKPAAYYSDFSGVGPEVVIDPGTEEETEP